MHAQWDRDALLAHPAFESLRPVLALCPVKRFPDPEDLSRLARERGLSSGSGAALSFVPAEPAGAATVKMQYEVRIHRDGEVPTRPGDFHDLFNALAWLTFPKTKALLNRMHYTHIVGQLTETGSRGTARDVLTLFDESGVIVACSEPELEVLLRGFEWKTLFWTRRAEVRRAMRFLLFGHGIHEKALRPFKGLTAKALVLGVSREFPAMPIDMQVAEADVRVADHFLQPRALDSTRVLAPLPILGVPGWEAANELESFYDDASVFRPGRSGYRK